MERRMRKNIFSSRLALVAPVLMLPFLACSSGDDSATSGGGHPAGTTDGGTGNYGADSGASSGGDGGNISPTGDGGVVTVDGGIAGFTTIFTIVLENHDYKEVVGDTTDAPFLNSLIADYGLATNYMDSGTHPSLPNYLDLMSGATQYIGIVDLDPTTYPFPVAADNLGNQLQTANIKWRAYAEGMSTPCNLSATGDYAPKHEPFLYFTNIQSGPCADTNVDYSSFATDLAAGTYRYMYIAPNLTDDGHNPVNALGTATDPVGSLTTSDSWCKTEVGKIMASDAYKNGGVIFITWDEAEGRNGDSGDQVPMIIVSPKIVSAGFKSAKAYSHASYLATVEDILGVSRLATVASEQNMLEFFK
jgi:hypothetical protein